MPRGYQTHTTFGTSAKTLGEPTESEPTRAKLDDRVSIPLDGETALRALLRVDPDSEPTKDSRP